MTIPLGVLCMTLALSVSAPGTLTGAEPPSSVVPQDVLLAQSDIDTSGLDKSGMDTKLDTSGMDTRVDDSDLDTSVDNTDMDTDVMDTRPNAGNDPDIDRTGLDATGLSGGIESLEPETSQ